MRVERGLDELARGQLARAHRPASSSTGRNMRSAIGVRAYASERHRAVIEREQETLDLTRRGTERPRGRRRLRHEIAEPDKDGGALRYRGVDIEDLVGTVTFEKVWGLLVDGAFEPGLPPAEPHPLTVRSGDPRVDVQSRAGDARARVGLRASSSTSPTSRRATTSPAPRSWR